MDKKDIDRIAEQNEWKGETAKIKWHRIENMQQQLRRQAIWHMTRRPYTT